MIHLQYFKIMDDTAARAAITGGMNPMMTFQWQRTGALRALTAVRTAVAADSCVRVVRDSAVSQQRATD